MLENGLVGIVLGILDTVGGYAFDFFGRILLVGEKISNENGIEFEVAAINANQISLVIMKSTMVHMLDSQ